jgi:hypothetical protein
LEKAAAKGLKKAQRRIRRRKMLDNASATAYLQMLKISSFKAVRQAYQEYRKLRHKPEKAEITEYLSRYGMSASVNGFYRKSIIIQSVLKGKRIFQSIKPEGFYNI